MNVLISASMEGITGVGGMKHGRVWLWRTRSLERR
jgi:hypothetical protein